MENLPKSVKFLNWNNVKNLLISLLDTINLNQLLEYLKNITKFDEYMELDLDTKNKTNITIPGNAYYRIHESDICISKIYYFYNNYCRHYFYERETVNEDLVMILKQYFKNNIKENEKINVNNLKYLIIVHLDIYELNELQDLFNNLVNKKLINYNNLFIELINLISNLGLQQIIHLKKFHVSIYNIIDLLWDNVKHDNNILSCLINNFPLYHNNVNNLDYTKYVKQLIDLHIIPNSNEIHKLLRTKYEFKKDLIEKFNLKMEEIVVNINNINDFINLYNLKITDEIKEKIMYLASMESYTGLQFKKLKKKYNLTYNDKCLEIYCNSEYKNITGFMYLVDEGCNVKLNDLLIFIRKIKLKSTLLKLINYIQNKCNINLLCF